jgi:hypothetical protein
MRAVWLATPAIAPPEGGAPRPTWFRAIRRAKVGLPGWCPGPRWTTLFVEMALGDRKSPLQGVVTEMVW